MGDGVHEKENHFSEASEMDLNNLIAHIQSESFDGKFRDKDTLISSLRDLGSMVGMVEIKRSIVDQIQFLILNSLNISITTSSANSVPSPETFEPEEKGPEKIFETQKKTSELLEVSNSEKESNPKTSSISLLAGCEPPGFMVAGKCPSLGMSRKTLGEDVFTDSNQESVLVDSALSDSLSDLDTSGSKAIDEEQEMKGSEVNREGRKVERVLEKKEVFQRPKELVGERVLMLPSEGKSKKVVSRGIGTPEKFGKKPLRRLHDKAWNAPKVSKFRPLGAFLRKPASSKKTRAAGKLKPKIRVSTKAPVSKVCPVEPRIPRNSESIGNSSQVIESPGGKDPDVLTFGQKSFSEVVPGFAAKLIRDSLRPGAKTLSVDGHLPHTLLYGPSGVGKTVVGKILANIWFSLGIVGAEQESQEDSKKRELREKLVMENVLLVSAVESLQMKLEEVSSQAEDSKSLEELKKVVLQISESPIVIPKPKIIHVTQAETCVKFRVVSRADFVAPYLGQTAIKTLKLLGEGGVLFIDEAYSLYTGEGDIYGAEALTTINKFMTDYPYKTLLIFAGYKAAMQKSIFAANEGMKRRFAWTFEIPSYKPEELADIFRFQTAKCGWRLEISDLELEAFFAGHKNEFPSFGGDTERLLFYAKLVSCRNAWKKKPLKECKEAESRKRRKEEPAEKSEKSGSSQRRSPRKAVEFFKGKIPKEGRVAVSGEEVVCINGKTITLEILKEAFVLYSKNAPIREPLVPEGIYG